MNLIILLIVLAVLFSGGGFYGYSAWGPHYGYGFGGIGGLIVLLILLRLLGVW